MDVCGRPAGRVLVSTVRVEVRTGEKIPEFCSVGGARSKKQHFSLGFMVPFDYPVHSLQETVLPQTNGTDGKPRL